MKTRFWFRLHSFTGIITGLLLFIICWSGTFAVLSNELDWLVTPEARVPSTQIVDWSAIETSIKQAYPDGKTPTFYAPLYPGSAAQVRIKLPEEELRVYTHPVDGRILDAGTWFNLQRFFRDFHRSLYFPTGWGTLFVSAFAVTLGVSLVAALAFYKRWWQRFFHLRMSNWRVFWSEFHKTAGLWSLWFIGIMVVTGGFYGFEVLRGTVGDGLFSYTGFRDSSARRLLPPEPRSGLPDLPLQRVLEIVQQARPDLKIRTIALRQTPNGGRFFDVRGQAGHLLVRNRANQFLIDSKTGDVLYNQRATDLPLYWRWTDTVDPLHFGNFGGFASKVIWFAFGLVLSGLILTGTWLHAHRLARDNGGRDRWPGTAAALVASLGVLGASGVAAVFTIRDTYGPAIDGAKQFPDPATGVVVVIALWVLLTLALIAAWTILLWHPHRVLGVKPTSASPQALHQE